MQFTQQINRLLLLNRNVTYSQTSLSNLGDKTSVSAALYQLIYNVIRSRQQ